MRTSSCLSIAASGIFVSSFFRLSSVPLRVCPTSSYPTPPSVDILVVSTAWLLWVVLLRTQRGVDLFELEFCLERCPGVELLGHVVVLGLVF